MTPLGGFTPGASLLHRLPSEVKLVALIGFVFAVVAAPREVVWPYFAFLAVLVGLAAVARLRPVALLAGLRVELPFVAFALLMPFVAAGERVAIGGVEMSLPGLWAAWALLAKGTLGVLAALILASTTATPDVLAGLSRLRVPTGLTEIMGLMIRYGDVVTDQWQRMSVARTARGFSPRSPRAWPALASSVGTLFVRSYERGERVHLAMLSRGYAGSMPTSEARRPSATTWLVSLCMPVLGASITTLAWILR